VEHVYPTECNEGVATPRAYPSRSCALGRRQAYARGGTPKKLNPYTEQKRSKS